MTNLNETQSETLQYVGGIAVSSIEWNVVTFTDWTTQTFTPRQMEYIVTNEPKDLTQIRELVLANVVPEILSAIAEEVGTDDVKNVVEKILDIIELHDLRRGDLAAVMDTVLFKFKEILDTTVKSYGEVFNKAIGKAFWTYNENKSSEYYFEDIRVSDMKKIIS